MLFASSGEVGLGGIFNKKVIRFRRSIESNSDSRLIGLSFESVTENRGLKIEKKIFLHQTHDNIEHQTRTGCQTCYTSYRVLSHIFEKMGRKKWHRYKRGQNGKPEGFSKESNINKDEKYSVKDRKLLFLYLKEYYERCTDLYQGSIFGMYIRTSTHMLDSDVPIVIGGDTFPMLDEEALQQPYLALPIVNAKRRKIIHHLCVYLNLYHVGVRVTPVESFVAISIFKDGLEFALQETECDPKTNFLDLKPWLYRGGDAVAAGIKVGHDAIYELIDQPGDCLRDGIDELDFEELHNASLENILPPRLEDDNWVLIDSPEKMRECIQEMEVR